jgi:hypothetical protein
MHAIFVANWNSELALIPLAAGQSKIGTPYLKEKILGG